MTMWKKYPLCLLLALLLTASAALAADASGLRIAPLSGAYQKYLERREAPEARETSGTGHKRGYFPSPVDLSHLSKPGLAPRTRTHRGALPASHDPRPTGLLSAAKDQPYDNCWSYSAIGAMETAHRKRTGAQVDLSEMHLTWYAYKSSPGFTDEDDDPREAGGVDSIAVATLARWIGAVSETSLPETAQPQGTYDAYPNELLLEDAFLLGAGDKLDPKHPSDALKDLVYTYGAASVGIHVDDRDQEKYYNEETYAYYYDGTGGGNANHAVLLVGWDDNYPRENFLEFARPSRNGAWLIRNSWGTNWGDDGYFWLSYEDAGFSDGTVYLPGDSLKYDGLYEYDELGWCTSGNPGEGDTAWFANVFRATNATQMLEAVSFYTTSNNAAYEVFV